MGNLKIVDENYVNENYSEILTSLKILDAVEDSGICGSESVLSVLRRENITLGELWRRTKILKIVKEG